MPLTERRKADRAKMAQEIADLAPTMGANAVINPEGYSAVAPRRVTVAIRAARGLRVDIDFDGETSIPDRHIVSWCIATDSDARLSDKFARYGSINPYHFGKATCFADGFDALCLAVEYGLECARDGSAFDAEREAAAIAKDGTAAEREARWAAYFGGRAA